MTTQELKDLTIVPIDYRSLTDEHIVALNAFENAMAAESNPEDPPTPLEVTRAIVTNHPDVLVIREFWAREPDGAIAAMGWAWWKDVEENRHVAWARVDVRPDRRGRGLAKPLLRKVVDEVAADGRTSIVCWTTDRVPAGEVFARRVGAEPGSAVHTNRLLLADLDREMVRRWVDEGPARASDYELLMLDGPYPDDLIEEICGVYDIMNTAPRDDLEIEDERHTVEEMRQREQQGVAAGTSRWSLFARHVPTGRLVGLTVVYWNPAEPDTVYQGDTGVHPDHRGHALGKWLKAEMLERVLRELPDAVDVRTGNADSNDAMLGINNALGFRPYIAQMNWQVPVERVQAYLDGWST
jgi:GNAT superfamily N-acetyltransferase